MPFKPNSFFKFNVNHYDFFINLRDLHKIFYTLHGFRKQFLTDEALKILHKAKELNPNGIYVFEPNGEIMTTDSFNRRLKKYCKEAGVPYHSSHKIRFYNASTAFDGNNLTTLSYLMGHSETATTLHYLRNVNKRKNDRLAFQNLGISS